mmetsp:Transcript_21922/g.74324  ORF Transcript_21922/g.74324 Transcript_21922/m.74324 type:complete len:291 (+) Transcript_21922:1975-2847(+)
MLFDRAKCTRGGTPPARPMFDSKRGSEAMFAKLNVAYSRTQSSGDAVASCIRSGRVPFWTRAWWLDSLEETLTRHMRACFCESTSVTSPAKPKTRGNPPCTMSWTCVVGKFAMLPRAMQAYLRTSTSKSERSFKAACKPPPRVAVDRVWTFAARLARAMIANLLQSTSMDEHSCTKAGVACAFTMAIWFADAQEMLYSAKAALRWTSKAEAPSGLAAMATNGNTAPALTKGTRFARFAATLQSTNPAYLAHSGNASASPIMRIKGSMAPCLTTCSWFDFSFVKLESAMAA